MARVSDSAAVSHVGRIRSNNQDSGLAGIGLFVVADGMGGHAGGDVASAIAITRMAEADQDYSTPQEAEFALQAALVAANALLAETVFEHTELTGMGTTVSALAVLGDEVAIAHIGDSRIYLYRDGDVSQITIDHTFVQRLVDSGRITEEEAAVHPRRSVLMRVLGDVDSAPEIDTSILATRPGDRWLLCSDGLSGVVSLDQIRAEFTMGGRAHELAQRLVKDSLDAGAPDNVTVVIVDIGETAPLRTDPLIVGSAASPLSFAAPAPPRVRSMRLPPFRLHPVRESHFEPDSQDYLDELIEEDRRRVARRRAVWLASIIALVAAIVIACVVAYQWTQTRYFVGSESGTVAIYRGVQQDLGPIALSEVYKKTDIALADLKPYDQKIVEATISAGSLSEAREIVTRLEASRVPD
ncbi:MAG: protein phosphatase 2C domain-containing protein [Microterricola sp.]